MDLDFLLSVSKIIATIVFFVLAIILLTLAIRSSTILKALEIIDTSIHGASAAILSQGSMILATIVPILLKSQTKSNIWVRIFKTTPWYKKKQVKRLARPIVDLTELAQQASTTFRSIKGLF